MNQITRQKTWEEISRDLETANKIAVMFFICLGILEMPGKNKND